VPQGVDTGQNTDIDVLSTKSNQILGHVNIGWTIGEELLFNQGSVRKETCFAETESCLLGINKSKLAIL